MTRPLSLTLTGWLLILWALYFAVRRFVLQDLSPDSYPAYVRPLGMALVISCGVGLLRGREWARFVFIAVWLLDGLSNIGERFAPSMLVRPAVLAFGIYLVYRPAVSEYIVNVATLKEPHMTWWSMPRRYRPGRDRS